MNSKYCLHASVTGLVQGVFFRQSTQNKARELNLTGWVKNLPNGDVELIACGNHDALEQLIKWLHSGPPAAKVEQVDQKKIALQDFSSFDVLL